MKISSMLFALMSLMFCDPSWAVSPAPSWGPVAPGLYGTRPVTAVGKQFQYSLNASYYEVFHRNADGSPGLLAQTTKSLWSIFQPEITSLNLNTEYPASTGIMPCPAANSNNPVDPDGSGHVPFAEVACIASAYDSDVYYDPQTQRIWILAHLRPNVSLCYTPPPANQLGYHTNDQAKGTCTVESAAVLNKIGHRYIAVAVSRPGAASVDVEDPANGFNSYILGDVYGDWTQLMVHNGLVLVNTRNTSPLTHNKLIVFGANDLITNAVIPNHAILPKPSATFDNTNFDRTAADWDNNAIVNVQLVTGMSFVRQQSDNKMTYLLAGSSDGKLVVYGLATNLGSNGQMPAPTLIMPAVVALPKPMPDLQKASGAYNNGYLYWGWDEADANNANKHIIRTFRWELHQAGHSFDGVFPIYVTKNAASGYLEEDIGVTDPNNSYSLPTMNTAANGDILTMYFTYPLSEAPHGPYKPNVRYAVLNKGTTFYQNSQLLDAGLGFASLPPSFGGVLDIVSVAADPLVAGEYVLDSAATDSSGSYKHVIAGVKP